MNSKNWSFQIIGQTKNDSKQFCLLKVSVNNSSSVSLWLWITETSHYHTCQEEVAKDIVPPEIYINSDLLWLLREFEVPEEWIREA